MALVLNDKAHYIFAVKEKYKILIDKNSGLFSFLFNSFPKMTAFATNINSNQLGVDCVCQQVAHGVVKYTFMTL